MQGLYMHFTGIIDKLFEISSLPFYMFLYTSTKGFMLLPVFVFTRLIGDVQLIWGRNEIYKTNGIGMKIVIYLCCNFCRTNKEG